MEGFDGFDQIGQLSNIELRHKFYKLKHNNFYNFFEESLKKSYLLYKKNKKSDISFEDYQEQLFKDIEKQNNNKNNKAFGKR